MPRFKPKKNQKLIRIVIGALIIGITIELCILFAGRVTTSTRKLENPAAQAKIIKESCHAKSNSVEFCYSSTFGTLTKSHPIDYSIAVLRQLQKIDPASRGCHLIAHSISIAETMKNPGLWKDIIAKMDINLCSGGFVHGVLEAKTRIP